VRIFQASEASPRKITNEARNAKRFVQMIPINTKSFPLCSADISFKSTFSKFYENGFMNNTRTPENIIAIIINFKGLSIFYHFVLEGRHCLGGAFGDHYYRRDISDEAVDRYLEITNYAIECFNYLY